jgi:hypothetical protein
MDPFTELSLTAQTAYAQLLESTLAAEHLRSVADLSGSFASKTVRGAKYWYFQYTEPSGKLRQAFVGADTDPVHALMARKAQPSTVAALGPLARSCAALGCSEILPRHLRVLRRLAEYGLFRAGGVLIGTHAFLAFANMLGVRWGDGSRTQDIDFAHAGKSLALALPGDVQVQTHQAIKSLEMGFLPVSGLASNMGATYLNPREPDFKLDFVTTLHRKGTQPYEHPQLGVTLQPLKFMEFSLENVQQAVLFAGDRCVVANVPQPARYALHKLLVYGEREGTYATKSSKDLLQARLLLAYLKEHRASEVEEAWADLIARGPGWVRRARHGRAALDKVAPALQVKNWLRL